MSQQTTLASRNPIILLWSLAVGLLFAAVSGIGIQGSGAGADGDPPHQVFVPVLGVLGFLAGALFGCIIGGLWNRRRLGHAVAFVLVTLVGGLVGVVTIG